MPNDFPYAGTSLHLLLVPRQHASDMLELGPAAQADEIDLADWQRVVDTKAKKLVQQPDYVIDIIRRTENRTRGSFMGRSCQ